MPWGNHGGIAPTGLDGDEDVVLRYGFDTLPSTNTKAWELIDQGISPPFWVVASQQTAGRGQWGRIWESGLGGLYLSVAIAFDLPLRCSPHLTLFSAWGIAHAMRQADIPVVLKWPNDLILAGRKLGGIKCEIRSPKGQISHAIIGVGINVCNNVPETGMSLSDYLHHNQPNNQALMMRTFEDLVVDGIMRSYERYCSEGMEPILEDYSQIWINLGQEIKVEGQNGTIVGITGQGELKVTLRSPGATSVVCLPPGSIQLGYSFLMDHSLMGDSLMGDSLLEDDA